MSERRRRKSLLSTSVSGLFFGTSSSTHSGKTGLCASGQPDGKYSASSAYRAFFHGAASLPGAKELWRTKAPARVKLFYWLDIHRRLWTAEHRKRHGLQDEDACALCNQEPETADHLLVGCVVTRELWSSLLAPLGLQTLAPTREEDATPLWWLREWRQIDKAFRPAFDTMTLLLAWIVWKERNARTFQRQAATLAQLRLKVVAEADAWVKAGFRSLAIAIPFWSQHSDVT